MERAVLYARASTPDQSIASHWHIGALRVPLSSSFSPPALNVHWLLIPATTNVPLSASERQSG